MPTISADHATRIAEKLLQGAGAPENDEIVASMKVQIWLGMIATVLYRSNLY